MISSSADIGWFYSTDVSGQRTSVGDPARRVCEALVRHFDAFGDFLCWLPDAAARRLVCLLASAQDRRSPVEDDKIFPYSKLALVLGRRRSIE